MSLFLIGTSLETVIEVQMLDEIIIDCAGQSFDVFVDADAGMHRRRVEMGHEKVLSVVLVLNKLR